MKYISSLTLSALLSAVLFSSPQAFAEELVATKSYVAPSCRWTPVYNLGTSIIVESFTCDGVPGGVTKTDANYYGTSCVFQGVGPAYRAVMFNGIGHRCTQGGVNWQISVR